MPSEIAHASAAAKTKAAARAAADAAAKQEYEAARTRVVVGSSSVDRTITATASETFATSVPTKVMEFERDMTIAYKVSH